MTIEGVSASIPPPLPTPPLTKVEPPEPQVEVPAADPPEPVETEDSGQRAEGVLRKLQEGHYKGVADVRLRINFHEEIAAAEAAAAASATSQAADDLTSAVNAELDELGTGEELTGDQSAGILEARETFNQAVSDTTAATPGAEPIAGEGFGGLQEAFDSLVTALEAVLAGGAEGPLGETGPPPAPAGPEETPPDPLQPLRDAFQAALVNVEAALIPQSSLPPLSQPMGNGVAYEKFLTMYDQLQAPQGLALPPVEETIDTTA